MSFTLRYRPFVRLRVKERDSDRGLEGFVCRPTPTGARSLANHRLVFRAEAGGFTLLYSENPEATEPVVARVTERTTFTFAMWHSNPSLLERFRPVPEADSEPSFHFHNLRTGGDIRSRTDLTAISFVEDQDLVRIVPAVFALALGEAVAGQANICRVEPRFGGSGGSRVIPVEVPPGSRDAWIRVDLSAEPPGAYSLDTDAPGATPRSLYVSDELATSRALAVVEIHWEAGQDTVPPGGLEYQIRFRSR